MSFKRTNNITGWIVCLIACAVYIMTMEATGSLWDCGEFASSAYKLQIPHPPGAPLFVLIARLFMAPFDPHHAATGVNLMSALASGFTILFLFWTITHFAKKIVQKDGTELSNDKIIAVMAAGVVGALAYTFSDSFWYSAVEGEVYALSSFFTGLVFWAMVKWEQSVTEEEEQGIKGHFTRADRWIILIFYLMGLSIGVHLLNLLTIPAIVLIYYYKRYKVTNWGTFFAFLIGCIITGVVQKAVIVWSIKGAGNMDILFVNSFGLPFFTGFAFFFVLIAVLVYFGLRLASNKNWNFLKLGLWSFLFMLLGYSTYFTTMVRSSADPSVDMFNVDNPVSLVGYVSREQYGDWPILFGQDFTAQITDSKITETYIRSNGKYEKKGRKVDYVYNPEDIHFLPRMWDQSNDQGHADYYANFAGIDKDKDGNWSRAPTMSENISFFMNYQINWMYWRYFMWNFAGKQNDVQGVAMGNVRDGNWKTGIGFLDQMRLGDQDKIPDSIKYNKANNKLFALPFILGLLGLFYQIKKDKRDALVTGLLFFFTGFAICLYLNQAGNQPRERDYAYVGSFYAFAIWIGIGVLYVKDLLMQGIKNSKNAAIGAGLICTLAVPVIMASQEWDDHDRSRKLLARDLATDYLESCAPNAILITFGDNDTYPLWYAQEVEGIRTDIRVINSSLLGTDWYINQLRYKVNQSASIDPIWTASQIEGSNRDVVRFNPNSGMDGKPMDLYTMMKDYAGSDDEAKGAQQGQGGEIINTFPTKKVFVPVDVNLVRQNGTVNASDTGVLSQISFDIPKNYLYKNDAAILNIIAANKWKRPIYFTSPYGELGFQNYLRQDGLTYRLVPISNGGTNQDWVMDKMMNKFAFGNANTPNVYYDEENRRHLNSIRLAYAQAAGDLANAGRQEDAKKLLNRCDKMMLEENFPYGMVSRSQQHNQISMQFLYSAYRAGDTTLAEKVSRSLRKDMEQQVNYYQSLSETRRDILSYEEERNENLLKGLLQLEQQFKNRPPMAPASEKPVPLKTEPGGEAVPTPVDTAHP
ncbi:MAG: DUF2723 domain-containing protein [Ferruginibacter sp.]